MMYNVNSFMFIEIYCYDCFSAPALERIMRQCLQGVGPADRGPLSLRILRINTSTCMQKRPETSLPTFAIPGIELAICRSSGCIHETLREDASMSHH